MTLKELIDSCNEQLLAKEARMNEIKSELPKLTDAAEIDKRKQEVNGLISERKDLVAKRDEAIAQMQKELEEGKKRLPERKENFRKMNRRESQNFLIGLAVRGKKPTDEEIRALDTSLTTTATTFAKATASVDGVNNGGIFIPTTILLDILREDKKLTPIMNDIVPTAVAGMVSYPYRVSRTTAKNKAEGKGVADGQMEWASLPLVTGFLQTQIAVTDEMVALTDMDFGSYIVSQLEQDLTEDWSSDVIYGAGASNAIKGITNGLTAKKYAKGAELKAIEDAVKALKGTYRRGAKLYLAQDLYDSIEFSKDSHGDYIIDPINNTIGVNTFAHLPVEVDETLKDGEFLLGNVGRYYRFNALRNLTLETERKAVEHITRYICSQFAAAAPVPNAFVYGQHDATLDK